MIICSFAGGNAEIIFIFKCLSDKIRLFLFSFHLSLKLPAHRRSGYEGAPVIALSASFQPALSHFFVKE